MPAPRSHVWLYILFFVTGVATVLQGVVHPLLPNNSVQGEGTLALALAVQFTGQLLGPVVPWRKPGVGLGIGCLIVALTCLPLSFASVPLRLFWILLYGFGLGISMTTANILIGLEGAPEERVSRLELLNIFWPLGAAFCGWGAVRLPASHLQTWPWWTLSALFLLASLYALRGRSASTHSTDHAEEQRAQPLRVLALALLALLAVGIESGIANWLPTFAVRYLSGAAARLPLPLASFFWSGILGGRLLAARALRGRETPRVIPPLAMLVCAVAAIMLARAYSPATLYVAAALASLGVAPVYPAVLAGAMPLRGKGWVFASAGIGSVLLPFLTGKVAVLTTSLRSGFAALAAFAVLLALGLWLEGRSTTARATRHPH